MPALEYNCRLLLDTFHGTLGSKLAPTLQGLVQILENNLVLHVIQGDILEALDLSIDGGVTIEPQLLVGGAPWIFQPPHVQSL